MQQTKPTLHFQNVQIEALAGTHLVFTLPLGFAYRYLAVENAPPAQQNQAIPAIMAHALSQAAKQQLGLSVQTSLSKGAIYLHCESAPQTAWQDFAALYTLFFSGPVGQEAFEQSRRFCEHGLQTQYRDPLSKGILHALEFTDHNKFFLFPKYASDHVSCSYEAFVNSYDLLVHPELCKVFLFSGESLPGPESLSIAWKQRPLQAVQYVWRQPNPYEERDGFKPVPAGASRRVFAYRFLFEGGLSVQQQFTLLSLLAETHLEDLYDVSVDLADASILYWGSHPLRDKAVFAAPPQAPAFDAARRRQQQRYAGLLQHQPARFCQSCAQRLLEGISLPEYIASLPTAALADLVALWQEGDPFVAAGGVIVENAPIS